MQIVQLEGMRQNDKVEINACISVRMHTCFKNEHISPFLHLSFARRYLRSQKGKGSHHGKKAEGRYA
jgi:hypothetical protein